MGKENLLEIEIIRHAQKGLDGLITEEGKMAASAYGKSLVTDERNLKVYTSDIQRAIDTGDLINIASESTYSPRARDFLSEFPYTPEKLLELGLDAGSWPFLDKGIEKLPSTHVIAGKLAKFILDEQRILPRISKPGAIHIVAVTHAPTIVCFLTHVLADEMNKPTVDNEVIEKLEVAIGNKYIQPLNGFKVSLLMNNEMFLQLGDINMNLNQQLLEDLEYVHDIWFE